jgi:hypothetical protein
LVEHGSPAPIELESRSGLQHGDSYSDVGAREDELAGSSSTHGQLSDRRLEEPSESALDAPDRLEGSSVGRFVIDGG